MRFAHRLSEWASGRLSRTLDENQRLIVPVQIREYLGKIVQHGGGIRMAPGRPSQHLFRLRQRSKRVMTIGCPMLAATLSGQRSSAAP